MCPLRKIHRENFERTIYEREGYEAGYRWIAGCDEVGRGPLAGPVLVACVILPKEESIEGIDDSKKLSPAKRQKLYDLIVKKAVAIGVGRVEPDVIDRINILQATYQAATQAVQTLSCSPDLILTDYFFIPGLNIPQRNIVRGDTKSVSIGAASIVAKVIRDQLMIEYDAQYPYWGFAKNKGYGTAFHIDALKKYGQSLIHRQSFIRKFVE